MAVMCHGPHFRQDFRQDENDPEIRLKIVWRKSITKIVCRMKMTILADWSRFSQDLATGSDWQPRHQEDFTEQAKGRQRHETSRINQRGTSPRLA